MQKKRTYIDRSIETIKELEKAVDSCNSIVPQLVFKAAALTEDSLNEGGEISYATYSIQMKKIEKFAKDFHLYCSCER